MHRPLACALALFGAACARGGGGSGGGDPIDARGQALQLVTCRSVIGQEFSLSGTFASTLTGLAERQFAARAGRESGLRAHPTDPVTVVFARQTRGSDVGSTELYVATVDGSAAEVRLTHDNATDLTPCWSADGESILFGSDRSGNWQIWRIARDGTGLVPFSVPPLSAADREPDAQGDRVVFRRTVAGRAFLVMTDGAGRSEQAITDGGASVGADVGDREPALARDGTAVAFVRASAAGETQLHLLDLATRQLAALPSVTGGGDRYPRFLPGDRLLAARNSPGEGLAGLRLVTMALDGSDLAQLSLDRRVVHEGFDILAGTAPLPAPGATTVPGDLDTGDTGIVIGRRALGSPELLRTKDGSGVTLITTVFDRHEVAGLSLPFKLPVLAATDVARARVRATCSLSIAGPEAIVRVSVKDYVRGGFDVAWEKAVTTTAAFDAEFTFASLAHVDRNRWIRIEIGCELPEGQRAEFTVDAVEVTVTPTAQ